MIINKPIKAIFPDENPLSPKIIECEAQLEVTDDGIKFVSWIFPKGSNFDDIMFFLEFTSNEHCKMTILGLE